VRTCPACGEDTEAGYSEPCTECGFSAIGEQPAEPAPEVTVGEQQQAPEPPPAEPQEQRKRSPARLLVWLVVIAGFFAVNQLGVFDEATGPTAEEVEQAIVDSARQFGVEVTVDCPDDAEDTEVDGTFVCTATAPGGRTVEIVVTNHEDTFEWETGPLTTLT
jgi:hypothetical protein